MNSPIEQFQLISLSVDQLYFPLNIIFNNCLLVNIIIFEFMFIQLCWINSEKNYVESWILNKFDIKCTFVISDFEIKNEVNVFMIDALTNFYPSPWAKLIEIIFEIPSKILSETIPFQKNNFFEIVIFIFIFILLNNLIGLLPYSFTTTSHLIISFTLSFSIFIGVNVITVQKHEMKIFELFLPSSTPLLLAIILVPLEFVSYLIKPISLGARLFINLMAGHTLLKVILYFIFDLVLMGNYSLAVLPFIVLFGLFGLELGVALIQAYVFIILCCIYIQDCDFN